MIFVSGKRRRKEDPDSSDYEFRRLVLNVVIAYLYAGRDRQAWAFYDREYQESDRDELKTDVIETAKHDSFYQELLQRYEGQKAR